MKNPGSAKRRLVCMFLNAGIAGDQRVFKEARTLADAGYEVVIICQQEAAAVSSAWSGIRIISIPRRSSVLFPGRFTYDWIKTALALKPDIIHSHDLNTLGRAWVVARLAGAKLIYDSHDYFQDTPSTRRLPSWKRWYYRQKEGFLIRRSDRVIHVVEENSLLASKQFRIPEPTVLANFPMGDAPPRSRILHDKFELSEDTRIVLYEGVVVLNRGLENLVLSARYLPPGIAIVILGEGYLKGKLQLLARQLGVEDRVKFIPEVRLEDFPVFCASADIGIAIYENEGSLIRSPTKVFDYIWTGLPTLVSGSKATEKVVRDYEVGIVLNDISPREIARKISGLMGDRKLYQRLQQNAYQACKKKFNWASEARKLIDLYRDLSTGAVEPNYLKS